MVSAGFKTIWVDLFRFCWNLIIFIGLSRFYTISTIWQIGVGWIDLGIFGELDWSIWFGELNWICFIFVMDSSCLGESGRISVDSLGFV